MTIALTKNYNTSWAAHLFLEQIIMRKLERILNPDYGLTLQPGTQLKIANTPDTQYLIQPELLAISKGLQYKEGVKGDTNINKQPYTYRGYVNEDGLREGVGITTFDDGDSC